MRGPGVGRPGVGRAHRPHAGAGCAAPEIAAGDSGADAGLRLPRGRYWFNGGYFQLGRAHIRGWRDLDLCKRGRCCIRLAVAALPVRDRGPRSGVDYQKTGHRSREAEHSVAVPIRRTDRSSRPYARTGNGKDRPVAGFGPARSSRCVVGGVQTASGGVRATSACRLAEIVAQVWRRVATAAARPVLVTLLPRSAMPMHTAR
jgi:hypothetical protein